MQLRKWNELPKFMRTREVRKYYNIVNKRRVSLMAKRLFDAGIKDGDVRAMIFWLKTRARWSEAEDKKIVELSGPEGAPIKFATDPIEASKVYQDLMAGKS